MKLVLPSAFLLASFAALATADETVVPNQAPTTAGSGGYSTLLRSKPRSYQLVVGPEELTGMPVGSTITGITWRRPTWQVFGNWPGIGFTCSWTNFDISLSTSLNPPGSLSTTYTDNIGPDVVLVRGGPIAMSGAFFPGGALTPQVNPFGTTLAFTAPYVYQGGNLLLTIRHDGNDCGGNGSLDTVPSPFTQAIGVSSYTQADNWYAQGLITMKLEFTPPGGPGSNYCIATPSSTGFPADISAAGSASVADNDLTLMASPVPDQPGLFFFGPGQQQTPFGNGFLCVTQPIVRIQPPAAASGGLATRVVDLPTYGITAGSENFQYWYRDPAGGGAFFNLSDGLEIGFVP